MALIANMITRTITSMIMTPLCRNRFVAKLPSWGAMIRVTAAVARNLKSAMACKVNKSVREPV